MRTETTVNRPPLGVMGMTFWGALAVFFAICGFAALFGASDVELSRQYEFRVLGVALLCAAGSFAGIGFNWRIAPLPMLGFVTCMWEWLLVADGQGHLWECLPRVWHAIF
jgi:hypothetical protein